MKTGKTYEDNVLIRLRRQYSKDEAVAALSKELSKAEFKYGEFRSCIDELRYNLNKSNQELKKERQNTHDLFIKLKNRGKISIDKNHLHLKITSLQNRLKKQFINSERLNDENTFFRNLLTQDMSEEELNLFYNERDKRREEFKEFKEPHLKIKL